MKEVPKACLSCSKSYSTCEFELFCIVKQKIVQEDDTCEDYN